MMGARSGKENTEIDIEIIWKKIYNQLEGDEEAVFERWMSESSSNRQFFQQVLTHHKEEDAYQKYHRKEAAWNAILNEATKKPHTKVRGFQWKWVASVAASISVIMTLVFYLVRTSDVSEPQDLVISGPITPGVNKAVLITSTGQSFQLEENESDQVITDKNVSITLRKDNIAYRGTQSETATNKLIIPKGGKFRLTLADGTRVWLNSETTLEYPVSFSGETRSVELTGEAYFEVVPSKKPFIVNASSQRITVFGTSFNVWDYDDLNESATTLVEGKVEVMHKRTSQTYPMVPDQHLTLNKRSGDATMHQGEIFQYVAWKEGLFVFEEASLEWIMQKLSRWYDIDVFYKNTDRKAVIFSGEIDRYEDFENVLNLLELTNEVQFDVKERTVVVK